MFFPPRLHHSAQDSKEYFCMKLIVYFYKLFFETFGLPNLTHQTELNSPFFVLDVSWGTEMNEALPEF